MGSLYSVCSPTNPLGECRQYRCRRVGFKPMGPFQSMEMGLDDGGIFVVSAFTEFCNCKGHVPGGLSEVVGDLVTFGKT